MTDWPDLVVAATVGTASRPAELTATPAAILDTAPPGTEPAGSLLDAAVAFTVAQRAGRPAARAAIPAPPAGDHRPTVSPLAAELLRRVLVDRELDLARLVLDEIVAAGRRLPDVLLPAALTLASRHATLRSSVLSASGPVAPWLGRQNPLWRWADAGPVAAPPAFDRTAWETGSRAERVAQLRVLRASEPAAASALLLEAWPTTTPDERPDLLAVLGPTPVPSDEPLLEATLDDRRAATRELVATLLARLEDSAFRRRAVTRAAGLLRVERRGLRRVVTVATPPPFDAAARRDGLQEGPGAPRALGPGSGPAAVRVRQVVAAAPLAVWERETGLTPAQLVGAALDPFDDEVRVGWIEAAVREGDPAWIEALLEIVRGQEALERRRPALVAALPPDRRDAVVVAAFAQAPADTVAGVLTAATVPWEPSVVTAFLRWWRRAAMTPPGRGLLPVLPLAARGLPATADSVAALRDAADRAPDGAIWMRAARAAADTIDLRRRLHEELR